jgi:hypothetical protein
VVTHAILIDGVQCCTAPEETLLQAAQDVLNEKYNAEEDELKTMIDKWGSNRKAIHFGIQMK